MSKFISYAEASRNTTWGKDVENDDGRLTMEQISVGCKLRNATSLEKIAVYVETIAKNKSDLEDEIKRLQHIITGQNDLLKRKSIYLNSIQRSRSFYKSRYEKLKNSGK